MYIYMLQDTIELYVSSYSSNEPVIFSSLATMECAGDIFFVQADGFKPIVESHLAGAAVGALVAVAAASRGNDS